MNKVFKIVWSKTRNVYVVVSEMVKSRAFAGVLGLALLCAGSVSAANQTVDGKLTVTGTSALKGGTTVGTVDANANLKVNGNIAGTGILTVNGHITGNSLHVQNSIDADDVDADNVNASYLFVDTDVIFGGDANIIMSMSDDKWVTEFSDSIIRGKLDGLSLSVGDTTINMDSSSESNSIFLDNTKVNLSDNSSINGGTIKSTNLYTGTKSGKYVDVSKTVGDNLLNLDTQVSKVYTDLSAVDKVAKGAIKGLSVSGKTITYTKGDGTTGTITTQDTNTTYKAGSGLALSGTTFSVKGDGQVAAGNTGLVTGNTVYTELRPTEDGTIVKKDNTTAANLTAVDNVLKNAIVSIRRRSDSMYQFVSADGSVKTINFPWIYSYTEFKGATADTDGASGLVTAPAKGQQDYVLHGDGTWKALPDVKNAVTYDTDKNDVLTLNNTTVTNLKAGALTRTSKDAVTGNQLWTTNQNVTGLKADVNNNKANIASLNDSVTNALESVSTLNTLVNTVDSLKADASLNNLSDTGKMVIRNAAADAVQKYLAGNNKVVMNAIIPDDTSSTTGGEVYDAIQDVKTELQGNIDNKADIAYVDDALAAKADITYVDEQLAAKVDVDSVYTKDEADTLLADKADVVYVENELSKKADKSELETRAEVDASNIDVSAWSDRLGTGEVADGNTGLVNGGTVYRALQDGLVKAGTDAIEIGSAAKYDSMDSVSVAKSDGSGRVVRGVMVDPADDTSAANVGYVNAVADNFVSGVNRGFASMDRKINKTGAGAAALANLHPVQNDGDTRWSIAAGIGRYHGESAGAVGLFYTPSDRVSLNVSSTVGNNDTMFGAGVSVAIDKSISNGLSKVEMAKTINAQAQQISAQTQAINAQAEQIDRMKQEREDDRNRIAKLEAMVKELAKK